MFVILGQIEDDNGVDALKRDIHDENVKKLAQLKSTKAKKRNVHLLLQNTGIFPFRWMKNLFICVHCDSQFTEPELLRQHHNFNHNSPTPADIKAAIPKLKKHELVKVDITSLNCKLCGEVAKSFDNLKHHLIERHNFKDDLITDDGVLPFKISKNNYSCAICEVKFDEYKTLNHHMNVHYQNFICEQCGSGFITPDRLRTHAFSHETGTFPCPSCNKVFRSMNARNEHHASVHKQVKRHRCPYCPEMFRNYFQRNKHITAVHGMKLKDFKCTTCPRVFSTSGKLRFHVSTVHLKIKRHACQMCEWKFYSTTELKDHMVRHGGERKYKCNVCAKAYARKYTLREHMRIHENDRRFICTVCGGSFVQKCTLKQHVKVNHPSVKTEFENNHLIITDS